ncbi:MAG: cyanophycinase [Bacteroidia bacterium]|nr:cyanophycinase [Bacteroidia bacterium]MCC7533872.1 cyanophycinase [Bacteroidia bacterium]MCZ2141483.1 cyanophycinase [Bacteroidia bacterium]
MSILPKGKLISVGGAEDKGTDLEQGLIQRNRLNFFELGILKRIVDEIGGKEKRIEVITTASSIPDEVGENYMSAFGKIGCTNVGIIDIKKREDIFNTEFILRIKNADGIMFSGGDQLRLTSIFGGSEIYNILHDRYYNEEGFVIAGTSAGAMAMSNTMIYQGKSELAHLKGEVKITTGLAFIGNVIIDSHFDKRGRFNRLAQAIASNPQCTGIGLGEDTGVIVTNGNNLEVVGSGAVVIVDGKEICYNNISEVSMGEPIAIDNLRVNILVRGNQYLLKERKFISTSVLVDTE